MYTVTLEYSGRQSASFNTDNWRRPFEEDIIKTDNLYYIEVRNEDGDYIFVGDLQDLLF